MSDLPHADDVSGRDPAVAGDHHATTNHASDGDHDDQGLADEWEPGPIDVAAWGAGALGVGLGLVVAACFALATAAVQAG
jgi:hypothetical protein